MASSLNICSHCEKATQTVTSDEGMLCCAGCGRIIKQDIYSTETTFVKGPGGQSYATGARVKSVASGNSDSYDRTLGKGRDLIGEMVDSMQISGGNSTIDQASGFYRIAVDRNFTRGRSTLLVAAACLYITCREKKKAYLLIDFSEYLQENVYKLGAVFLQLCQLLRLQEHPIFQKPVDPSLFIHRFTERLLGGKHPEVSRTALRIIASMKRDWMQTGRKPSGLCGAALYISALSYGLRYSKSDVVTVVHVCEATLTKRLIEFENTESGSLTIDEFNKKADEFEREAALGQLKNAGCKSSGSTELLCEHKGTEEAHFAHGLCKACYDEFITISGGIQGGSEPPAFQRAEKERMAKEAAEENAEEVNPYDKVVEYSSKTEHNVNANNEPDSIPSESACAAVGGAVDKDASDQSQCNKDVDADAVDELETLSDIDDVEVDGYLHNDEEKRYKEILWVEMNKEYLEEQALKEAAAAAARKAYEAQFQNCSEGMLAKKELIEAAQAAVAKSRKEKRQKKAAEAKSMPPPQNVTEAARRELTKKRLSSKINFDALGDLFDDSTVTENTKKARGDDRGARKISDDSDGDIVQEEDFAEEVDYGTTYGGDDLYYGNESDGYGYDEDYGY